MTRNVFILFALSLTFLHSTQSFATADSAVLQGIGGAGRAGIPKESLFSNPAGAAFLKDSAGFVNFTKPTIPDFNAGGRGYTAGLYDGGQSEWKGAFGYSRTSEAVLQDGRQGYDDRSEFRFVLARPISESVFVGGQGRYVKVKNSGVEKKFVQGDVGVITPLFTDMRAGLTYENIVRRDGEAPPTLGAGVLYNLSSTFQVFADATRQMGGAHSGDKGWNGGVQTTLIGGIVGRVGKFQDGVRRLRGWTVGGGWIGPRTSLDYAMRTVGTNKRERDHIFGLSVAF